MSNEQLDAIQRESDSSDDDERVESDGESSSADSSRQASVDPDDSSDDEASRPLVDEGADQLLADIDAAAAAPAPRTPGHFEGSTSKKTIDWWLGKTMTSGVVKNASVQVIYHDLSRYVETCSSSLLTCNRSAKRDLIAQFMQALLSVVRCMRT